MQGDLVRIMYDICMAAEWACYDEQQDADYCSLCGGYQKEGHSADCLYIQFRKVLKITTVEALIERQIKPYTGE